MSTDAGEREVAPGLVVRGVAVPLRLADFGLAVFDMDSTLISIECVDEIAGVAGKKAEVAAITGLDALSARHVKGLLQARVRAGCTVIMTTHILEVAERMADRIGVIAAGRLIAEGTLDELRQRNDRNDTLEDMFIALVDEAAAA